MEYNTYITIKIALWKFVDKSRKKLMKMKYETQRHNTMSGRFQVTTDLELRLLRKDSKKVKYHFNNNNKLNKLINEQAYEL